MGCLWVQSDSDDAVFSKVAFEGLGDDGLRFLLGEVVGHERCVDAKIQRIACILVPGNARFQLFLMESKTIVEKLGFDFLHGEDKQCEVIVNVQFGK